MKRAKQGGKENMEVAADGGNDDTVKLCDWCFNETVFRLCLRFALFVRFLYEFAPSIHIRKNNNLHIITRGFEARF